MENNIFQNHSGLGDNVAGNKYICNFDILSFFKEKISNKNLEKYNSKASELIKSGKINEAINELTKAINEYPKCDGVFDIYYNRATLYFISAKDKDDEYMSNAISDYSNVIILNDRHYEAYYNRGTIYAMQDKYGQAIENLEKTIGITSEYSEPYNNLGQIYLKQGKLDEAYDSLKKAEESELYKSEDLTEYDKNKYKSTILTNIGNLHLLKGDLNLAIDYYEKSIETFDDKYIFAYLNLATTYMMKYKSNYDDSYFHKSLSQFEKCIEIDSDFIGNYLNKGDLYNTKGDIEYLNGSPDYTSFYQEALELCNKVLELYSKSKNNEIDVANCMTRIAIIENKLGNRKNAIEYYEKSIEKYDKDHLPYYNLANIYSDVPVDHENAIKYYKKCIDVEPNHTEAYNSLGICYLEKYQHSESESSEDFKKAKYNFEKTISLNNKHGGAYFNLGTLYTMSGENSLAIDNFIKAEENGIDSGILYYSLGRSYSNIGKSDESVQYLIKAYESGRRCNEDNIINASKELLIKEAQNSNIQAHSFLENR